MSFSFEGRAGCTASGGSVGGWGRVRSPRGGAARKRASAPRRTREKFSAEVPLFSTGPQHSVGRAFWSAVGTLGRQPVARIPYWTANLLRESRTLSEALFPAKRIPPDSDKQASDCARSVDRAPPYDVFPIDVDGASVFRRFGAASRFVPFGGYEGSCRREGRL